MYIYTDNITVFRTMTFGEFILWYLSVIDSQWTDTKFTGMKLAGILIIAVGFLIVQIPTNMSNNLRMLQRYVFKMNKNVFFADYDVSAISIWIALVRNTQYDTYKWENIVKVTLFARKGCVILCRLSSFKKISDNYS